MYTYLYQVVPGTCRGGNLEKKTWFVYRKSWWVGRNWIEMKWNAWNEWIDMNQSTWMTWNKGIETHKLKRMTCHEWIEMKEFRFRWNEGIDMKELTWRNRNAWLETHELTWTNWNKWIDIVNWNEWLDMTDLKWRNWNEWIELHEWNAWIQMKEIDMNQLQRMSWNEWTGMNDLSTSSSKSGPNLSVFYGFYVKSSSCYSLVHILSTSSSKSEKAVSFWRFFQCDQLLDDDVVDRWHEALAIQSRAHFVDLMVDLIFKKWSEPISVLRFLCEIELSLQHILSTSSSIKCKKSISFF